MLLIQYNVKHPLLPLHVDWPLFPLLVELPQPFEQPVRQLHVEQLLLFERLQPPSADHTAISSLIRGAIPIPSCTKDILPGGLRQPLHEP